MQALTGTPLRLAAAGPSATLPMASSEIFGSAMRVSVAPLRTSLAGASQSLVVEAGSVPRREKVKTRHMRIRRKLSGTAERPRLAVFRSNKHIYAQVIDDGQMHTLAAASTMSPALREELTLTAGPTVEASRRVGAEIAKICLEKGITKVSFDRGGFIYHGRIKALADGAREAGLEF